MHHRSNRKINNGRTEHKKFESVHSLFNLPIENYFLEDMRNLLEISIMSIWGKGRSGKDRRKKMQLYSRVKTSNISAAKAKAFLPLATMGGKITACMYPTQMPKRESSHLTSSAHL